MATDSTVMINNTDADCETTTQAASTVSQSVTIMGSTGSIGQSTLAVLALHPGQFHIFALTANTRAELLKEQCIAFNPRFAVLRDTSQLDWLQAQLKEAGCTTEVLGGEDSLCWVASHTEVDTVMAAIVGAAGLPSSLAAAQAGKKILLANKEALVVAGSLFMQAAQQSGAMLLPVDSEHNAIFQCLPASEGLGKITLTSVGVSKILLTGSGGPFRTLALDKFSAVTPEQACAHPNWDMGKKISVDSATMMNKGLELIEACWLFNCDASQIDILIHPQSVIHSMVEYLDGSVVAQMGRPDMRTPIAHALAWPNRIESDVEKLDWTRLANLTFEQPDIQRFPALKIARDIATQRGSASIVLNAANEVAVDAFLKGDIAFTRMVELVDICLQKLPIVEPESLQHIQSIDAEARQLASQLVA